MYLTSKEWLSFLRTFCFFFLYLSCVVYLYTIHIKQRKVLEMPLFSSTTFYKVLYMNKHEANGVSSLSISSDYVIIMLGKKGYIEKVCLQTISVIETPTSNNFALNLGLCVTKIINNNVLCVSCVFYRIMMIKNFNEFPFLQQRL